MRGRSAWIVSLPTLTANGESGTVSANNYVKGDSAVVNARNLKDPSAPLSGYDTKFFEDLFLQQVASSQQQGFKVVKKKAAEAIEGQETIDVEYRYDLLINGVPIGRHGFAKVVKVGNSAVSLGATTTDSRYKGMKVRPSPTPAMLRAWSCGACGCARRGSGFRCLH